MNNGLKGPEVARQLGEGVVVVMVQAGEGKGRESQAVGRAGGHRYEPGII